MAKPTPSRRAVIKGAGIAGAGAWLGCNEPPLATSQPSTVAGDAAAAAGDASAAADNGDTADSEPRLSDD